MLRTLFLLVLVSLACSAAVLRADQTVPAPVPPSLDYQFFKDKVQPILLAKRPGHVRCITCHVQGSGGLKLELLSPGATTWDEEQSKKNFESVVRKVVPGNLKASRLLMHPLRAESGGDVFHFGGGQWNSVNHPEWQIIAAWVRGEKSQ